MKEFMKENKQATAQSNLDNIFSNFTVVTQQRHKVKLEEINKFDQQPVVKEGEGDASEYIDTRGSLISSLISQIKKNKKEWNLVKELYLDSRKKEKYLDVVSQGLYVTSVEAEDDFKGKENKKSIRYVFKPNNSIDDSEIKYKESDLIKYYADHKFEGKYQNDNAYRVVKFFSISNAPSQTDSSEFFGEFNKMQEEFANAEDDTLYSNSKSEMKMAFFNARSTVVPENHFKGLAKEDFTDILINHRFGFDEFLNGASTLISDFKVLAKVRTSDSRRYESKQHFECLEGRFGDALKTLDLEPVL